VRHHLHPGGAGTAAARDQGGRQRRRSNWKDDETASDSTYVCAKGGAYLGVALKGMVVKAGS